MATVITPTTTDDSGAGMGMVVAVFMFILLLALLWFVGVPLMRSGGTAPAPVQNSAPQGGGVNLEIPDKVDVNVNKPQ